MDKLYEIFRYLGSFFFIPSPVLKGFPLFFKVKVSLLAPSVTTSRKGKRESGTHMSFKEPIWSCKHNFHIYNPFAKNSFLIPLLTTSQGYYPKISFSYSIQVEIQDLCVMCSPFHIVQMGLLASDGPCNRKFIFPNSPQILSIQKDCCIKIPH